MTELPEMIRNITIDDMKKSGLDESAIRVSLEYWENNKEAIANAKLRKGTILYFGSEYVKLDKPASVMTNTLKKMVVAKGPEETKKFVLEFLHSISFPIMLEDLVKLKILDRVVDGKTSRSKKTEELADSRIIRGFAVLNEMLG